MPTDLPITTIPPRDKEEREVPLVSAEPTDIKKILNHLHYMVDDMKSKEKNMAVDNEWKALAQVIDRLFFFITLIAVVVILPLFLAMKEDVGTLKNKSKV